MAGETRGRRFPADSRRLFGVGVNLPIFSGGRLKEYQAQVAAARDAFFLTDQAYKAGLTTNLEKLISQNRYQQAELQLAAETLNRKIMYLRLVRQTGALVDEVGRLGTPVAGAQAAALTAENAENAEKKMIK